MLYRIVGPHCEDYKRASSKGFLKVVVLLIVRPNSDQYPFSPYITEEVCSLAQWDHIVKTTRASNRKT